MACFRPTLTLCAALALSGCTIVEKTVQKDAKPTEDASYVAGVFTVSKGNGFALGLRNVVTRAEYLMEFGEPSSPQEREDDPSMIQVQPGTYNIAYWQTFDFTRGTTLKKDLAPDYPLARVFDVKPGQILFLGRFSARTDIDIRYRTVVRTFGTRPISSSEALRFVRDKYPGFADVPVACLICAP